MITRIDLIRSYLDIILLKAIIAIKNSLTRLNFYNFIFLIARRALAEVIRKTLFYLYL